MHNDSAAAAAVAGCDPQGIPSVIEPRARAPAHRMSNKIDHKQQSFLRRYEGGEVCSHARLAVCSLSLSLSLLSRCSRAQASERPASIAFFSPYLSPRDFFRATTSRNNERSRGAVAARPRYRPRKKLIVLSRSSAGKCAYTARRPPRKCSNARRARCKCEEPGTTERPARLTAFITNYAL